MSRPGAKVFKYRVTEVTGSMVERLRVGAIVYDSWMGDEHLYEVVRMPTLEVSGSYRVVCEGEASAAALLLLARRAA